jgi:hypothetical protein
MLPGLDGVAERRTSSWRTMRPRLNGSQVFGFIRQSQLELPSLVAHQHAAELIPVDSAESRARKRRSNLPAAFAIEC